jgi:hypothetical protein
MYQLRQSISIEHVVDQAGDMKNRAISNSWQPANRITDIKTSMLHSTQADEDAGTSNSPLHENAPTLTRSACSGCVVCIP